MKKAIVALTIRWNSMGFEALAAPTEDGVFWLSGHNSGVSRALHRAGEVIAVQYIPEDQFAYEVQN